MSGRAYTIFDTAIGRCGVVWGEAGILAVQLPEARELETRRRILKLYPDARETRPSPNVQGAIEGMTALLRGEASDLSAVRLDMAGFHVFEQRVYEVTRRIPRGETLTYDELAVKMGAPSTARPVARAIARNPFVVIVPCHRVLERGGYADAMSPYGGLISKRRLLSIEGAKTSKSKTLLDVFLPVAPPRPSG